MDPELLEAQSVGFTHGSFPDLAGVPTGPLPGESDPHHRPFLSPGPPWPRRFLSWDLPQKASVSRAGGASPTGSGNRVWGTDAGTQGRTAARFWPRRRHRKGP